jgi:hypothetical protein
MDESTNDNTIVTEQESEPTAQMEEHQRVEEIDSLPTTVKPSKPALKTTTKQEELIPNPLLEDPYEWDLCTITVVYTLLPDQTVSVSIHNHKDEPLVKSFAATEVPLPENIDGVMRMLRDLWPDSTITATIVLMPKPAESTERAFVVSVRAGNDTPIMQAGVQSNLFFPLPISMMLDELKATLPVRALKRIEKDAKTKIVPAAKPVAKASTVVPATSDKKAQLSLF